MAGPKTYGHARVLCDLLRDRRYARGAEIGVNHGMTALYLLEHLPGIERYYAVDPWEADSTYLETLSPEKRRTQAEFDAAYAGFLARILPYAGKVAVLRLDSLWAADAIPRWTLDWAFIDGVHTSTHCRCDIDDWVPKVVHGGLLAGHDYNMPGVRKAVDERFRRVHVAPENVWWVEV